MSDEIKAQRAAIAAKRAELMRQHEESLEAGREQRELAEETALYEAEQKYGVTRVRLVQTDYGAVIVRAPHSAVFRRFQDKGSTTTKDVDELVRPNVVYPDIAGYESIIDKQPAVLQRLADAVVVLAGHRKESTEGKS